MQLPEGHRLGVYRGMLNNRDDFDLDMLNFSFFDGDVPHRPSHAVFISQLKRFPRGCSHVHCFNSHIECLTAYLLQQGHRYHKLRKAFSLLYRRHHELVSKFIVRLKSLFHQGLSEL